MPSETPAMPLQITRRVLGRTLILTLDGVADHTCVNQLENELNEAAVMRPQHVLIDLTHVQSIADLVNGTLSVFANTVRDSGGNVRFLVHTSRRSA